MHEYTKLSSFRGHGFTVLINATGFNKRADPCGTAEPPQSGEGAAPSARRFGYAAGLGRPKSQAVSSPGHTTQAWARAPPVRGGALGPATLAQESPRLAPSGPSERGALRTRRGRRPHHREERLELPAARWPRRSAPPSLLYPGS